MELKEELKEIAGVFKKIKACKTFYDFMVCIRDTDGLRMVLSGDKSWLEFRGNKIENTTKQRFTSQSDVDDLVRLALRQIDTLPKKLD